MLTVQTEGNIIIATFAHKNTNTLTAETLEALRAIVQRANDEEQIKGIVLTGQGRTFSSGFDLPLFLSFKDPSEVEAFFELEEEVLLELFTCHKPVVAAINGHAVAGGLLMAMACDYRIVKDHPRIRIGMSEITIGLPLSIVQSGIMRFGLDSNRSFRDIMYNGAMHDVTQARALGIVDEIVADDELLPRAEAVIRGWIDKPGRAFIQLKEGLKKGAADTMRARLANEDWRQALELFFRQDVRAALDMVNQIMA